MGQDHLQCASKSAPRQGKEKKTRAFAVEVEVEKMSTLLETNCWWFRNPASTSWHGKYALGLQGFFHTCQVVDRRISVSPPSQHVGVIFPFFPLGGCTVSVSWRVSVGCAAHNMFVVKRRVVFFCVERWQLALLNVCRRFGGMGWLGRCCFPVWSHKFYNKKFDGFSKGLQRLNRSIFVEIPFVIIFEPVKEKGFFVCLKIHVAYQTAWKCGSTVDGSEIRQAPVDMVDIPIIYRFLYIPGGCLGFLPSTVSPNWLSILVLNLSGGKTATFKYSKTSPCMPWLQAQKPDFWIRAICFADLFFELGSSSKLQ